MNEKGQSALEYIATYGWALIVIVIVAAALFALGVLNPATFQGETCTGFSGLSYVAHTVDSTTFSVIVANGEGEQVTLTSAAISFDDWDTNSTTSMSTAVAPVQESQIDITITAPDGAYAADLQVAYTTKTGLNKTTIAKCTGSYSS